ncbi:hypothetical protein J6590_098729 [Homalodisca vitripennis]|nr:hypothetical protein J6590_098729 [Homalodisca vitripennis]
MQRLTNSNTDHIMVSLQQTDVCQAEDTGLRLMRLTNSTTDHIMVSLQQTDVCRK